MFDLEREVDGWTAEAFAGSCGRKVVSPAELRDHLYCEIERLQKEGEPLEEAFRIATAKLEGAAATIAGRGGDRALRRGRLAHAILWAALILALAIVFSSRDVDAGFAVVLTVVLVPIWFASDQLLVRLLRAAGDR